MEPTNSNVTKSFSFACFPLYHPEWERGGITSSLLRILHNPGYTPLCVCEAYESHLCYSRKQVESYWIRAFKSNNECKQTLTMRNYAPRKKENWRRHFKINNQTMKNLSPTWWIMLNCRPTKPFQHLLTNSNTSGLGFKSFHSFWVLWKRHKGRNKMPKQ